MIRGYDGHGEKEFVIFVNPGGGFSIGGFPMPDWAYTGVLGGSVRKAVGLFNSLYELESFVGTALFEGYSVGVQWGSRTGERGREAEKWLRAFVAEYDSDGPARPHTLL